MNLITQSMGKTFKEISKIIGVEKLGRISAMKAITFPGDIFIYGVWSGMSTKFISDYLHENQIQYSKMFGLDSFVGLPDEKDKYIRHPDHNSGTYSAVNLYNDSVLNTMTRIQDGIKNDRLKLISGFYSEVLNKELAYTENMIQAAFIDMDVDLCSSAITVLDFMYENSLIQKGTVIYFDDWGATSEYEGGVSLAWKTIVNRHSVKYEEIFSSGIKPNVIKVFVIK